MYDHNKNKQVFNLSHTSCCYTLISDSWFKLVRYHYQGVLHRQNREQGLKLHLLSSLRISAYVNNFDSIKVILALWTDWTWGCCYFSYILYIHCWFDRVLVGLLLELLFRDHIAGYHIKQVIVCNNMSEQWFL